jgi:osmotically-inducible protein OsmY
MRSSTTRLAVLAAAIGLSAPAVNAADKPDAWITTKAKIALFTTKDVSSTAINVDTMDGHVTLQGKVSSAEEKAKAENAVREISGVKEVRDLLQVVPETRQKTVKASDTQLKKQVEKTLKDDKSLAKSSISVQSVNAGVVVLTGKASSMETHLRAIEDARGVPGVRQVSSEVQSPDTLADEEIRRDEGTMARGEGRTGTAKGAISDAYITSATKLRLMANSKTPALDINVDTNRGVVTLFGIVPSREAKAVAEADARKVSGVRRVANELQVVSSAKQPEVKAKDEDIERGVKKALAAHAGLGDAKIDVDVKNGVARLTGTVPSEQDRLSAAVAARSAPGVRSIQDDLRISTR